MQLIHTRFRRAACGLAIAAGALLAACEKTDDTYRTAQPADKVDMTSYDYLRSRKGTFDSLCYLLDKTGLKDTLQQKQITFFAPTDVSIAIAMKNLNTARELNGLPTATMDSVDVFVWRQLLMWYMFSGSQLSGSFAEKDGKDVLSINRQKLHVDAVRTTTQGVVNGGGLLLKLSDLNGSRFIKDWVFSFITTADIQTKNGVINVMERTHILGFRSFVEKASMPQNEYSHQYLAAGTLFFPTGTTRPWYERGKKVTAINATTCETEAADLFASGYVMRLAVQPDNSVIVTPAPQAANQTISNNGPCYYDPAEQAFVLDYKYSGSGGYRIIKETIQRRNF